MHNSPPPSSPNAPRVTRRRALQTIFCSSAMLSLNLRRGFAASAGPGKGGLHFLAIGDFGTGGADQQRVAGAMRDFVGKHSLKPDGLWLVGDNFYSKDKNGFSPESPRWKKEIEEMYPASVFPGPQWAVLGNHDYHDNEGGEQVQLAYARKRGVRWTLPAKWYRLDLGSPQPLVTFLCLDSNLPTVSGGKKDAKTGKPRSSMTAAEETAQLAWFKAELAKPRAPFTVVVAHHPVYSNGSHGDTKPLIAQWGGLMQEHKVHAYLCGHDHDLQHLELEKLFTSFVLSGGGGAKTRDLDGGNHKVPFGKRTHGFTHLGVTADELTFTHYDDQGAPLHGFTKKRDGSFKVHA